MVAASEGDGTDASYSAFYCKHGWPSSMILSSVGVMAAVVATMNLLSLSVS